MAWNSLPRAAQTGLGVYLKRTRSRVTSTSSALGVLNDYALYESTHSLTDAHSPVVLLSQSSRDADARDQETRASRRIVNVVTE